MYIPKGCRCKNRQWRKEIANTFYAKEDQNWYYWAYFFLDALILHFSYIQSKYIRKSTSELWKLWFFQSIFATSWSHRAGFTNLRAESDLSNMNQQPTDEWNCTHDHINTPASASVIPVISDKHRTRKNCLAAERWWDIRWRYKHFSIIKSRLTDARRMLYGDRTHRKFRQK